MSKAPQRILARADRNGAQWKVAGRSPWFGEAFEDEEYIRAGALPWEEMKIACYEEFAEPEDRADYAVRVLERVLALREQEEGNE